MKIVAGIVIVIVILAVIILLLPDPENPPPPSTGGSATAGITIPDGEDKVATQKSIDASNAVVLKASNALAQGDTAGFTSVLVSDLKTALSGTTLNPASAKTVADSLKKAKVVSAYPGIVYYEMNVGNTLYSFYSIEEDGSWKIAGL